MSVRRAIRRIEIGLSSYLEKAWVRYGANAAQTSNAREGGSQNSIPRAKEERGLLDVTHLAIPR